MKKRLFPPAFQAQLRIGMFALWLLSACAGPVRGTQTEPVQAVDTGVSPTPTSVIEESKATPTLPPVSAELHATDPATVSLASGKVQLVEFFAFW